MNTLSKLSMVLVIFAASVGFAQPQAQSQAELQQLNQQAQRLMVLQALPEEARTAAEGLLEQHQILTDSAFALRTEHLQALVDALEAGESPPVARELADQAVSDARLALLREATSFRNDVRALVDTYPEARGILGRLGNAWQDDWQRGWDDDANFGAGNQPGQSLGNCQNMGQPGMMQYGQDDNRQGYGNQPGMMQRGNQSGQSFGNRQNMGQPGMMQRGQGQFGQHDDNHLGQSFGNHQNMGQLGMMQRGQGQDSGQYGQNCGNQPGMMQQGNSGGNYGGNNGQGRYSNPMTPQNPQQQQLQQQDGSGPPDNAPQGQQNSD